MNDKDTISQEDVRICACHPDLFWRRDGIIKDGTLIRAHGYATRHGFDGKDLVNTFTFTPTEWESLKRV